MGTVHVWLWKFSARPPAAVYIFRVVYLNTQQPPWNSFQQPGVSTRVVYAVAEKSRWHVFVLRRRNPGCVEAWFSKRLCPVICCYFLQAGGKPPGSNKRTCPCPTCACSSVSVPVFSRNDSLEQESNETIKRPETDSQLFLLLGVIPSRVSCKDLKLWIFHGLWNQRPRLVFSFPALFLVVVWVQLCASFSVCVRRRQWENSICSQSMAYYMIPSGPLQSCCEKKYEPI